MKPPKVIAMSENQIIPPEIEASFAPRGAISVRRLGEGIINATLLLENSEGQSLVLQRLSRIFDAELIDDYGVVSNHLKREGWEIPGLVETVDGRLYDTDESGNLWRAFEYVQSDSDKIEAEKIESLAAYGVLLGKLHRSLAKLDYRPQFGIPHFHDTEYYAGVLESVQADLPEAETQQFADRLLTAYHDMTPLPSVKEQLIHGDPRLENILHRNGEPFTFIDWDTLMHGSVWIDLGDMLRSLAGKAVAAGQPVPIQALVSVAEGYRQATHPQDSPKEFQAVALKSAQFIALELAMRFTADYKDGAAGYFMWDEAAYPSRHMHNMFRARQQWAIVAQLQAHIDAKGAAQ
ncbi:MAG TPA: aminoglycoside phosphotransferase family protein [Candidatus Saccharimonadales bacterium]|nr:aminoglycoside phosphotransferase family protein [Candidatus Saccharimonadales bacterium]